RFKLVGPDTPVVGTAGSDIVLPCSVKREGDGTSLSAVDMEIKWTRPDLEGALVHFYTDYEDVYTKQISYFRGRTSLFKEELQKGNTSLRLSNVNLHDEGEYRCLVESVFWHSYISVELTVKVIGEHPVITVESYDDNSKEFSLLCESKGWRPHPDLQVAGGQ
ncbi:hypothetical protein NFI96_031520, partial [Prochilodus magdalenae]